MPKRIPCNSAESLATLQCAAILATLATASNAHCVIADDRDGIWVCEPKSRMLLYFLDSLQLPQAGR